MDEGRRQRSGGRARAPDESLLIEAIRYQSLEMPPRGKLPESEIAVLERWVRMGAPDPRTDPAPDRPVARRSRRGPLALGVSTDRRAARAAREGRRLAALRRRSLHPRQARVGGADSGRATPTGRRCCGESSSTWSAFRRLRPRSRRSSRTTRPTRLRGSSMRSWAAPNSANAGAVTGSTWPAMPTPTVRTRTSPTTTPGVIATT